MKSNKNLLFLVGTLVFAAILTAAAVLLVRGILRLSSTESDLQVRKAELDRFYANDPYPSPGNVQRAIENGQVLMGWFKDLLGMARRGQVQPAERSPSNFMSLLGDRRTQLSQLASANNVTLSRDFAFGFDRYFAAGSMLPAPEDVPRLAVQLLIIDKLCTALFEERAAELVAIDREEFETAASGTAPKRPRPGRPAMQGPSVANAWIIGKDALFGKMHFVIEMRVRENALLAVLNRLAKADLFCVLTGLAIEKDGNDVKPVPKRRDDEASAAAAAKTNVIPPHAERIISGLEVERPMRVTLDVDVYRFPEGG